MVHSAPVSDDILVQQDGVVATVVLNRPAMRNAINLAMWTDLARLTEKLGKDDSVWAIVYRGAGTEAFASGADISEFPASRKDTETASRYNATTAAAYAAVRECPKPTIAMIYGYCMGGAVGLSMACDLRFAAEGSKFGIPAARLSIIYPAEAIAQLVDLVGPAYAKDILFSARVLDGREALAIGSHPAPGAGGRSADDDRRLSQAARRQRPALAARLQADDPVLPGRLHRRESRPPARRRARGDRERRLP